MKNKKKTTNKTIGSKISSNINDYQQRRKEHHIWIWLILFSPVGIYKSIKYKCFTKPINILLSLTFCICIILGIDNFLYPDRVIDNNLKKTFISSSETHNLGDYRFGEKIGTIKNEYIIYSVTSTTGTYDFYLSDAKGKNIAAIRELTPNRNDIFISNNFDNSLKNIYPEILRLYTKKDLSEKLGEIKKIKKTVDSYQEIECINGNFRFQVDKGVVTSVFKVNNNGPIEKIYNGGNNIPSLPNTLTNYLNKNKKSIGELGAVISYTINDNNREYVLRMRNGNFHKIKLYDDKTMEIYNEKNNISVSDNK